VCRHIVDDSYRVLDYIMGYFLFLFLFLFSFLQVFDWIQTTLLQNIRFKKQRDHASILGADNYVSSFIERELTRDKAKLRREFDSKYAKKD